MGGVGGVRGVGVVESSDLVLTVGCVWTEYSTVGYSLLLEPENVEGVEGVGGVGAKSGLGAHGGLHVD